MTYEENRAYNCGIEPFSAEELASVIKFDSRESSFIKAVITPDGWERVCSFLFTAEPSQETYLKFKSLVKEHITRVENEVRMEIEKSRREGFKINFDPPLGGTY